MKKLNSHKSRSVSKTREDANRVRAKHIPVEHGAVSEPTVSNCLTHYDGPNPYSITPLVIHTNKKDKIIVKTEYDDKYFLWRIKITRKHGK